MLYRIRHDDCGTIFRYVTFEQTQKKKCPKCKQKLDSMKMATVGLEKSKQGVLV
mgnify:CR=1 FL=1